MNRFLHFLVAGSLACATACSHVRPQSAAETLRCVRPEARPSSAARYVSETSPQRGGDVWIARYDHQATRPAWKTPLGKGQENSVASVVNLNEREIAVVGSTTAQSVSGVERTGRGRTGFALRLAADSGNVLSGSFLGDAGETELTSAAAARDGRVLVAGVGGEARGYGTPSLPRIRQVWSEGENPANAKPVFLSVYTADLRREIGRLDLGAHEERRPRVWLDCEGNPVIGTVAVAGGDCAGSWPDLVYQQGQFAQNYDIDANWNQTAVLGTPPGGWGFHALRWKSYHAGPSYVLTWPPLTQLPKVPKSVTPSCADAQDLNTLEGTQFLPPDPNGGWGCGQHTEMAKLGLTATFLFSRWTTPVYTHVKRWDNLNGPWVKRVDPVAVERVVFHPVCPSNPNAYTGQKIEDLCDLSVDDVANIGCQASDIIGGLAGNGFLLRFERLEGTRWYNGPTAWYQRPITYSANTGAWWYNEWYEPGDYVFDPPDGSETEQAAVRAATQQLAGGVVRSQRVVISTVELGRVTARTAVDALVEAND